MKITFRAMLPRIHRIAAAIELFALVMWIGGLFYLLGFAAPTVRDELVQNPDAAWATTCEMIRRFAPLELVFALVVLVSNFFKVLLFRSAVYLQRVALLLSAVMLLFTVYNSQRLMPMIEERRAEIRTLNAANAKYATERLRIVLERQQVLLALNLGLGLFLVYTYRTFEERKLQALASILKGP